MIELVIDANFVKNQDEIHKILATWLNFPSYYGKNLDALFDCLCELNHSTKIVLKNSEILRANFDKFANDLIDVFQDAASENENLKFEIK